MTSKQTFKDCPLFDSLSEADIERFAAISLPQEWGAGVTIFAEGEPAKNLYVLERGKVALQMQLPSTQPQVSRKITVDVVIKGEVLGWSAVVQPFVYTMTAVCLETTRALAIDSFKFRNLLKADHRLGYEVLSQLIGVVASRLNETRYLLISERLVPTQS
ncbi:MAG: Crp/Fnr family transcriptional regulator [Chloroflexi bacterium]|nr:Crp/Fnr family transcriptional regulator [Chloroflexota bacterium]